MTDAGAPGPPAGSAAGGARVPTAPPDTDPGGDRSGAVPRGEDTDGGAWSAPPGAGRTFRRLLANTLVINLTGSFLWFALTFWVYLETRSVVATGIVGAAFGLASAVGGPAFGTFVDRRPKHTAMVVATVVATACFAAATVLVVAFDAADVVSLRRPWFWLLVATTLAGSVAAQIRSIALATCVTLLIPPHRRDRANGMVGTVVGVSFTITSVFSGLAVGGPGIRWAYGLALALTVAGLVDLLTVTIPEPPPEPAAVGERRRIVDVAGALEAVRAVPGLGLLIGLAAFNNLLGGVFMALVDPYGLELTTVEVWGLLWGLISLSFVTGGIVVARRGLGADPLAVIIGANLVTWATAVVFPVAPSLVLLTVGLIIWLGLVPAVEAAEHTILQTVVPYERQGRVFGFSQLVENAASPLTALAVAPLAEVVFIPLMTDGAGARWIGDLFGTGPDRGMALMFIVAGVVGVVAALVVRTLPSYAALRAATRRETTP